MKKILCLFLSCIFVVGVCFSTPVIASAEGEELSTFTTDSGEFQYVEGSDECVIKSWYDNNDVTVLVLPESVSPSQDNTTTYTVTGILSGAFSNCDNLEEITIKSNIKTIEAGAFAGCTALKTFVESTDPMNTSFEVVDGVLFNQEKTTLIAYPAAKEGTEYQIPAEVETFLDSAFEGAEVYIFATEHEDNSITIPDGLAVHYGLSGHEAIADEQKRKIVENPTCTEAGATKIMCPDCDYVYSSESITATGHTESYVLKTAPTCDNVGVMNIVCTVCGELIDTLEIAKSETHTYEWVVASEASCTVNGVEEYKCTVCGDVSESRDIAAQHKEKDEITKEATCSETGLKNIVCEICEESLELDVVIPAKDHVPSDSWTFVKDSTCEEEGLLEKKCKNCPEILETQAIGKKQHSFGEWYETKAATCEDAGEERQDCVNCDGFETREIAAIGHSYSEEYTVDVEAGCETVGSKSRHCLNKDCESKIDVTEIEATGHIDIEYETIVEATCTTAGSMLKKCKCGKELETIVTSPKDHVLSDWIVKVEATCTTAGSQYKECTACKAVLESGVIDILGHQYGEWVVTKEATCLEDGSKYRICSVCEEKETVVVEKIGHANAELINVKEATCLEDGFSGDLYCPDCKKTIESGEVLEAIGHIKSDWIVDKEATFTETGKEHKECTICKVELETAEIAKLTLDTPKVKIENAASGIKVTWTQDEDAAGYTVYRAIYNAKTKSWSKWVNRGTAAATKSSWVDKKVENGVTYKYTARAVNGKFKSDFKETSALLHVTAPKTTCSITATGILTKWNKIENADSYIIYRAQMVKGKWSDWKKLGTTNSIKNSWLDDKVESGVTYRYTVRAVDGKVKSGYTASASIIYLSQPTVNISNGATGIVGKWESVDGATGYIVYRSEYNTKTKKWSKWINLGTTKATTKSFTDKTVKSGTTYKYTLRAVNGKLKSTYEASNTLLYLAQPTLKITNAANGIQGSWNKVTGATGYTIYRSELKDGKWTKWITLGTAKSTAKSFTDKTVKSGVTYKYTVRAVNGKYKSSYVASNTNVFLSVPVVKIANAATGVKSTWAKIEGATGYIVYRSELSGGKWTKWKNLGTVKGVSYIDESAVSNVQYKYTVRAVNGDSMSVYTSSTALLYLATPTATIEVVDNGIKVSWTKAEGAKGYTVYRSQLGEDGKWTSWKNMGTAKATKFAWTDKSVEDGVTYKYTVRAICDKVKSAYVATDGLVAGKPVEEETTEPTTEPTTTPTTEPTTTPTTGPTTEPTTEK